METTTLTAELARYDEAVRRLPWWGRWLVRRASGPVDLAAVASLFRGAQATGRPVGRGELESVGVPPIASGLVLFTLWNVLTQAKTPEAALLHKPSPREMLPRPRHVVGFVLKTLAVQFMALLVLVAGFLALYWWLKNG